LYVVIECRTAEKESTKAKVGRNFYVASFGYLHCVYWISITFPCDSPHLFCGGTLHWCGFWGL